MDDRFRRELTKLRGGELPDDLWDRVMEGPRLAPLAPRGRSRVTAAVVAFAVFGLAAFFLWRAFAETPVSQPAGSDVVTVPPRGETSAVFLADGRPVFVVHHQDGTVSVVDAFSSHRAWGVEELNVWCPSTREFVEVAHEAHFDEYGTLTPLSGPAGAGGVATFTFAIEATDAVGDPRQIRVEDIREPTTPGRDSGVGRPPFCPASEGASGDADLVSVTGAYTGESGMVVAHGLDGMDVWDSPADAVAAAPAGWIAVRGTLHVAQDGFVQLCAQVVGDRCDGGVVVRGVDGIGLYLNVTRFPDVTGYEEPQVWLVQIHDGVIDNPGGVTNTVER
jgi:hypothetical protein